MKTLVSFDETVDDAFLKNYLFFPVGRVVTSCGMKAVREYYEKLAKKFVEALNNMLVPDAVMMNTDRHFENFGFMVDNKTNKIVAPAPLFDHSNALLNFAGRDDTKSKKLFVNMQKPWFRAHMTTLSEQQKSSHTKHREGLRKLLEFGFKKNSRYNLSDKRLKMLEKLIRERAKKLLD